MLKKINPERFHNESQQNKTHPSDCNANQQRRPKTGEFINKGKS